jgi:hypothetical protein
MQVAEPGEIRRSWAQVGNQSGFPLNRATHLGDPGRIESGQLCTVVPIDPATLRVGDIVLCRVGRYDYLHLINAIDGTRSQIANSSRTHAFAVSTSVEGSGPIVLNRGPVTSAVTTS